MDCWICGKRTEKMYRRTCAIGSFLLDEVTPNYYSYPRCYCDKCIEIVKKQETEDVRLHSLLKRKIMFYTAVNKLERQNIKMYDYIDAIKVVEEKMISDPEKFDSSYEMIAAIVLVKNLIYSKMQYPIDRYRVDFFLPEDGVILEVDGERHKYHRKHDSNRDAKIKSIVGPGWEIIRISTDYLDQRAERLPDAIQEIKKYREENHINWRRIQKEY